MRDEGQLVLGIAHAEGRRSEQTFENDRRDGGRLVARAEEQGQARVDDGMGEFSAEEEQFHQELNGQKKKEEAQIFHPAEEKGEFLDVR